MSPLVLSFSRALRRHPRFTLAAAAVLGIGVAAAGALLAVVRGVVLRPLPYRDPDRLVVLVEDGPVPTAVNWPTSVGRLEEFSRSGVFAGGLAGGRTADLLLASRDGAARLPGVRVTGNLFDVLGVAAERGRLLAPRDAAAAAPAVVVLADSTWRRRFGGDPGIVGRALTLDGQSRTVVGIAPPGFAWPRAGVEAWIPFVPTEKEQNRAWFALRTVGRLAPGVTAEVALRRLVAVADALDVEFPETDKGNRPRLVPLLDDVLGTTRRALDLVTAAVCLVLLITVANVASLLVTRGAARQGELAVRTALGAGRGTLLRMQLREGIVVGALAAAIGVPLGVAALRLAVTAAGDGLPRAAGVRFDGVVVLGAIVTALVAATLAAGAGALASATRSPSGAIRGAGKGGPAPRRRRLLATLVVVEVAAATSLAAASGLLARSLAHVLATAPGFDADGVVTLEVAQPPGSGLDDAARYYRRLLDRVREVPGLDDVSAMSRLPVVGAPASTSFALEGRPVISGESPVADLRYVEPGALALLHVTLLAGRAIGPRDDGEAPRVVLVNAAFVRQHLGGGEAVGKRFWWGNERGDWRTVVGVVGDVHLAELERPVEPTIWAPLAQASFPGALRTVSVVARTRVPPAAALAAMQDAITSFDALQAPSKAATLTASLGTALAPRRFQAALFAAFAIVAGVLAVIGVYAVISYSVVTRRAEFGVRVALGSRAPRLVRLVVGEAVALALVGALVGAALAVAGNRLIAAALVETLPWDPGVLALVVVAALVAAVGASAMPAARAARTSPVRALRG